MMSIRRLGWPMSWPASPPSGPRHRRTAAVELAAAFGVAQPRGLTMAAISAVFTISYVANLFGEEDWLFDISTDMFPEDGCLWVYGVGEGGVPAFTQDGNDNPRQIIADQKAAMLTLRPRLHPCNTIWPVHRASSTHLNTESHWHSGSRASRGRIYSSP